jgi:NAD(P)-dependent dehydrogenase (short-subunit alcohol dehydrogenase family)
MMARALALNGASKVFIIGRRKEALQRTADSVPGNNIIPVQGDITCKVSLANCVKVVESQSPKVDVLITSSGVPGASTPMLDRKTGESLPLEQVYQNLWTREMDEITHTYQVNLTGTQFTIAAFLPLLAKANEPWSLSALSTARQHVLPQIITLSSASAWTRLPLHNLAYGPSKSGILHLTKLLATAFVPYNIRVNCISPGLYFSAMTDTVFKEQGVDVQKDWAADSTFPKEQVPATRGGDELDIAGLTLWLCSRAGAYINGTEILTDGGWLSVVPGSY